jgi:hypothetical protein
MVAHDEGVMEIETSLVSLAIFVIVGGLVLLFLLVLYRVLRFVWAKVPQFSLSIDGPSLDKMLGVTASLIIVPSIAQYAWGAVSSLFAFFASQINRFTEQMFSAITECNASPNSCAREILPRIGRLIGETATGTVQALDLGTFPVSNFVLLIVLSLLIAKVINVIHDAITAGQVDDLIAKTNKMFPPEARGRLFFGVLVILSFYLGLSALLAIPLFQDKSRPLTLTVELLDKALEPNVITPPDFDKLFPVDLAPFREISEPRITNVPEIHAIGDDVMKIVDQEFNASKMTLTKAYAEVQKNWSILRHTSLSYQVTLREQAKNAFTSGLEVGIGHKQTAEHYNDLILWHQVAMQRIQDALQECIADSQNFRTAAERALETNKSQSESVKSVEEWLKISEENQRRVNDTYSIFDNARNECHPKANGWLVAIPQRRSFTTSLGAIGTWSGWLLSTEQMPVVIIVGLVGFSLLGATVSRAVRMSADDSSGKLARLTIDDLVIVIAVGATAAVVVFLAAYGGMAVLGGNAGDPNPYVLFVTCLIGAVYSEDVWRWARGQGLPQKRGPVKVAEPAGAIDQSGQEPTEADRRSGQQPPQAGQRTGQEPTV